MVLLGCYLTFLSCKFQGLAEGAGEVEDGAKVAGLQGRDPQACRNGNGALSYDRKGRMVISSLGIRESWGARQTHHD